MNIEHFVNEICAFMRDFNIESVECTVCLNEHGYLANGGSNIIKFTITHDVTMDKKFGVPELLTTTTPKQN